MSKHTPGPWRSDLDKGEWYVVDAEHTIVAELPGAYGEAQRANAHLIAAAPELYEALRRISLAEADGLDCARDSMVLERAINIARATIAKAKGENEDAVHRGEE
jgi:hypothetical protein